MSARLGGWPGGVGAVDSTANDSRRRLRAAETEFPRHWLCGRTRSAPHFPGHAAPARRRRHWRHLFAGPRSTIHDEADRAPGDLRRPGGDRYRERAAVPGAGGAEPRPDRGAGTADGNRRDPAGHQPSPTDVHRCSTRSCAAPCCYAMVCTAASPSSTASWFTPSRTTTSHRRHRQTLRRLFPAPPSQRLGGTRANHRATRRSHP